MRTLSPVSVIAALALMTYGASAETVRFVNGNSVRGKVSLRGDYVSVTSSDGQTLRVRRALVTSIEPGSLPPRQTVPAAGPETGGSSAPSRAPLREALEQSLSVDFQQMPLPDVVQYLRAETGLNFVIDPNIEADKILITLSLKDMKLINVLRWIGQVGNVAVVIRGDGPMVRLASRDESTERLAVEDVRPVLLSVIDRPAQPFNLSEGGASSATYSFGGLGSSSVNGRRTQRGRDPQDIDLQRRGHDMLELLTRVTGTQNWDHAFVSGRLPEKEYLAGE